MILPFVRPTAVVYRMNGTHADIPSSSSVPVSPVAKAPKYGSNRSLPTIRDMDTEQGSLGSQGSVDLPVDSGQARLIELGKSSNSRHATTLEAGQSPLYHQLLRFSGIWRCVDEGSSNVLQQQVASAGYKQELTRRLGPMTSFSLSISAMCFFSFIGEPFCHAKICRKLPRVDVMDGTRTLPV